MSNRHEELEHNLRRVEAEIAPFDPTLIVVTKTYPVSDVEILHSLGVKNFGENRSDEGLAKSSLVDARWHYQGEIQSKKIKEILSWADYIHSLDNLAHAQKIERSLGDEQIEVFLQLSLDGDPERGGLIESELFELARTISAIPNISLLGVMSVPPVAMEVDSAFAAISKVHQRFIAEFPDATALSAGMSGDYLIALNHGATHIRVGSKILGARQYDQ
jgi:pyridoxal phosphate enzyme (YggS family)